MAWTAPRTWTTAEIVTAAMMNEQVRNNELYLKGETDKLDNVSSSEPSRVLDTVYQNTSGKIRLVSVGVSLSGGVNEGVYLKIGASSPPATTIGMINRTASNTGNAQLMGSFIVPPSWYYKVETYQGTPTLQDWHEWDLH